jgi:predicted HTH transcriptional regulator
LLKTLLAFANAAGGRLVIGVVAHRVEVIRGGDLERLR